MKDLNVIATFDGIHSSIIDEEDVEFVIKNFLETYPKIEKRYLWNRKHSKNKI